MVLAPAAAILPGIYSTKPRRHAAPGGPPSRAARPRLDA